MKVIVIILALTDCTYDITLDYPDMTMHSEAVSLNCTEIAPTATVLTESKVAELMLDKFGGPAFTVTQK